MGLIVIVGALSTWCCGQPAEYMWHFMVMAGSFVGRLVGLWVMR